ncbi:MAG: nuclear transport factor 2 family protein [Dehalococcoidia bacterium]|nr:nuclear transport factor 2 family protein [Dehalococcoidia bacterium]
MKPIDVVEMLHWAIQARDWDTVALVYGSDATYQDPEVSIRGGEAILKRAKALEAPFSDVSYEILGALENGSRVAVEWRYRATNHHPITVADGVDLPATGKRVEVRGMSVFEVEGEKIVDEHAYWDDYQLYHDLGLVPAVGLFGSW